MTARIPGVMAAERFTLPPGVVIFEDPPQHTVHRNLLSRVFTPKKVSALEPQVRAFCQRALDPLGILNPGKLVPPQ